MASTVAEQEATMAGFELPDLPYDYDALAPYIDERTMKIHHDRHHAGYTDKLNAALEGREQFLDKSAEEILRDLDAVPKSIRTAVRNNGGGYVNHSLFWEVMSPEGGGEPKGALGKALKETFGSFEGFRDEFSSAATGRFGSGWAWLVVGDGGLEVYSTPNQDSPYMKGDTPILGLDVWEHAYYLKYQNKRGDYVSNFWNVVHWPEVSARFKAAR